MIKSNRTIRALPMAAAAAALVLLCTTGCAVYDESPRVHGPGPGRSDAAYYPYAEPDVVSVYVEPPLSEPPPIAVPWAPPPMLREMPPPMPFPGAVWVGGYWVWQGNWVWATGRWAPRPRPDYAWVQPYYEHRDGMVIFITGHWCPPGSAFVPPPRGMRMDVAPVSPGARRGYAPVGPPGAFMPPPPGSRPGLILPAPPPPQRPQPAVQSPLPAPVPVWRGGSRPPMPAPDQDRERDTPREGAWRPARTWGHSQDNPQERGQDRRPTEPQRRSFQTAPPQAAPIAVPSPAAPAMPPEPRRRDDRMRMDAPPARAATDPGQAQPRRDEGPRRSWGQKGDRDKRDGKSE